MTKPLLDLAPVRGARAANRSPAALSPGFVRVGPTPSGEAAREADVYIYGDIGGWLDGVVADDLVKEIAALDVDTLNVRINSVGGLVFDGIAIYNAIAAHRARVVMHIDSIAASIASIIAMAGDEIRIAEAASIMIHKPHSFVLGDAETMRKEAEVLDLLEAGMIEIYAARTGKTEKDLAEMLAAETWFRGQAAVDAGFADAIMPSKKKEKPAKSALLAHYAKTPADLTAADTEHPRVREFERLLRDGENASNAQAKRLAALASRIFQAERDVPPIVPGTPAPRDEDGAGSRASADRLAAYIRTLIR